MTPLGIPTYSLVTLGGIVVGLGLLLWDVSIWWASHKKKLTAKSLRDLAPTALCFSYGTLLILCAGGIIGALADWSLWGSNEVGNVVLVYGVGTTTPTVTRATHLALTPGGHAVVILATVVLVAVTSRRGMRWDFVRPVFSGVSLGLAKSIAGAAGIVLAPSVSWLGDMIAGLL
ncbi:hypothetical protein [Streptomyces antibioticus]|uniref:hypothetical protein n=1 Tax=Streptomyces antibioticus TaxID=1890 RepID=UPI0033B73114